MFRVVVLDDSVLCPGRRQLLYRMGSVYLSCFITAAFPTKLERMSLAYFFDEHCYSKLQQRRNIV